MLFSDFGLLMSDVCIYPQLSWSRAEINISQVSLLLNLIVLLDAITLYCHWKCRNICFWALDFETQGHEKVRRCVKSSVSLIFCSWWFLVDIWYFSYICIGDTFFCLADVFEAGLLFWRQRLSTQCSHSPSYSPSSLTVLSNTDRSLSNNQIELLNKGI